MITPEEIESLEKSSILALLNTLIILVISGVLAYICSGSSFYTILAVSFFVLLSPYSNYFGLKLGEAKKRDAKIYNIIYLILFLIGVVILAYTSLLTWNELMLKIKIKRLDVALIVPFIIIVYSYYMGELFERRTVEIVRSAGRYIGDRLRTFVTVYSIAVIGFYAYLFRLNIVEGVMAGILYLYGVVVLVDVLRKEVMFAFRSSYREARKEELINMLEAIPAVRKIEEVLVNNIGKMVYIYIKVRLSPLLSKEEAEDLRNTILSRSIYEIPFTVYAYVDVEPEETNVVTLAYPADEANKDVILPIMDAKGFYQIKYDITNHKYQVDSFVKIEEQEEDRMLDITRSLLSKKVEGVLMVNNEKMLENELTGWFIKIFKVKKQKLDEAIEEIKERIVSWKA
ncbi:MAG: hypothetical protein ACP6IP_09830 [Candidatus Njordarchaeia archaeon]